MTRESKWKPDPSIVEHMVSLYAAGESCEAIGATVGASGYRVAYQLQKAGVTMRGPGGAVKQKTCRACGSSFRSSSNNAQFCSKVCQYGETDCEWCGTTFTKGPLPGRRDQERGVRRNVFCGRACEARGRRVPDDRRVTTDGYISIRLPDDWPFHGERYNGTMLEHRMVMALSLGRPLGPDESVHHINGVRDDNRLENLQLRQGRHGKGARFVCLDCGSHNVEASPLT